MTPCVEAAYRRNLHVNRCERAATAAGVSQRRSVPMYARGLLPSRPRRPPCGTASIVRRSGTKPILVSLSCLVSCRHCFVTFFGAETHFVAHIPLTLILERIFTLTKSRLAFELRTYHAVSYGYTVSYGGPIIVDLFCRNSASSLEEPTCNFVIRKRMHQMLSRANIEIFRQNKSLSEEPHNGDTIYVQ